jgi:thiaminase
MPFNTELAAGSLSEARFKHYITQDAHYLEWMFWDSAYRSEGWPL